MTALLPPNLLRLFAPRPQPPFLKPLTKDDSIRGPNKLVGVGELVKRIREEAEDAEVRQGLKPDTAPGTAEAPNDPDTVNGNGAAKNGDAVEKQKIDANGDIEMGEVQDEGVKAGPPVSEKSKGKQRKVDKIAAMGIVGQEARKMRKAEREKRKEQYKKDLEANCKSSI